MDRSSRGTLRVRHGIRVVAVAVLLVVSGVALCGHIPAGRLNPLDGAIGSTATWAIACTVLGTALLVATRPLVTRARWGPPRMRAQVVIGVCLGLLAQFAAVCLPHRGSAQVLTGVAVALVLLGIRGRLGIVGDPLEADDVVADDVGESLQHWVFRTEALISWSEASRSDWDRRVRPVLARQFEVATKADQRRATDPAAFQLTGKMLFDADLWKWVDPDNVVRGGVVLPGPGRRTLERIIECLEQV
jgi:hypothetical protein